MLVPSPAAGGFTSVLTGSRCFVFMGLSSLSFGQPLSLTLGYRHTGYFCSRWCQVKPQSGKHFLLRNADTVEHTPVYALAPSSTFTSSPRAAPGPTLGQCPAPLVEAPPRDPTLPLAGGGFIDQPPFLPGPVGQPWLFGGWLLPLFGG